jgi:phosphoribosylaminoimidazole carboxylase PurE protein
MSEVAVILGSESDMKFWEDSKKYLEYFNISADIQILSAHRTPDQVKNFALSARGKGYKIIIAAAGMAAHLAGAIAAYSDLPVLGVPLAGGMLDGFDALLSTVQMPAGVPVATFAVGVAGMRNACIFCALILSLNSKELSDKIKIFKQKGASL